MRDLNIEKRIILLVIAALLLFGLFIALWVRGSLERSALDNTAREYHQIVVKNNLAPKTDFQTDTTKSKRIKEISSSLSYIKAGLMERAAIIKYDERKINSTFSEIETLISNEEYVKSLNKTKEIIKIFNEALEKYKTDYQKDITAINKTLESYLKVHEVANHTIEGVWASVNLVPSSQIPKEIAPDAGFVILKKEGGVWKRVFGPGTYFEEKMISAAGVPQSIINARGTMKRNDQLNPLVY